MTLNLPVLDDAECARFHPEADWDAGARKAPVRRAIAICRTCPARAQCLELGHAEDALMAAASVKPWGIFGGTTPEQRQSMRAGAVA